MALHGAATGRMTGLLTLNLQPCIPPAWRAQACTGTSSWHAPCHDPLAPSLHGSLGTGSLHACMQGPRRRGLARRPLPRLPRRCLTLTLPSLPSWR